MRKSTSPFKNRLQHYI